VAGVDDKAIRLSCTTKQFEQLDAAESIELLSSADLIETRKRGSSERSRRDRYFNHACS
jgi:hypothetical protein